MKLDLKFVCAQIHIEPMFSRFLKKRHLVHQNGISHNDDLDPELKLPKMSSLIIIIVSNFLLQVSSGSLLFI